MAELLRDGAKAGSSSLVGLRTLSVGQCRRRRPPFLSSPVSGFASLLQVLVPPDSPGEGLWEGELSLAISSAAASRPPTPRDCPPSFGKGRLFFFPEGGSERKKMTPFEGLGILLQNP